MRLSDWQAQVQAYLQGPDAQPNPALQASLLGSAALSAEQGLAIYHNAYRARLLEAIQTLGHVTTFEGSRHLDCYDPRARKMELVKAGHDITTTWRITVTESGDHHRIGVYTLNRGANKLVEV